MAEAKIYIEQSEDVLEFLQKVQNGVKLIDDSAKKLSNSLTGTSTKIKSFDFDKVGKGIEGFQKGITTLQKEIDGITKPGLDFDSALGQLQSTSGITGNKLEQLGQKARDNAIVFGVDASKSVGTFTDLLNKLSPELAKSPESLSKMASNVLLLSKTMGDDQVGATELLTGAMNQFGVSMENPVTATIQMTKMMNAMSAASVNGTAHLPQIKEALQSLGNVAKKSGLGFEESLAAIELLDKNGFKAAEGGNALKDVLNSLTNESLKDVQKELKNAGVDVNALTDTSRSFTDRLRLLEPVLGNTTLTSKVFKDANVDAAKALIQSAGAQDKMTFSITGTNQTMKQARPIMQTKAQQLAQINARMNDYKIALFKTTHGLSAFLSPISQAATTLASFGSIVNGVIGFYNKFGKSATQAGKSIDGVSSSAGKSRGLISGLGSALKGVGWGALIGLIGAVASRLWDVASGADQARMNTEAFQKGQEKGQKRAGTIEEKIRGKYEDQKAEIQRKLRSREITQKQADEQLGTAAQEAKGELSKEQNKIYKERQKAQKKLDNARNDEQKFAKKVVTHYTTDPTALLPFPTSAVQFEMMGEGLKRFVGSEDSLGAKKAAALKDRVAADAAGKDLSKFSHDLDEDIKDIEADKKEHKFNSPAGYDSGNTDKTMTGGGEIKNINVRIDSLVKGDLIFQNSTNENLGDLKKKVTEVLIGAVRDFEIAL